MEVTVLVCWMVVVVYVVAGRVWVEVTVLVVACWIVVVVYVVAGRVWVEVTEAS